MLPPRTTSKRNRGCYSGRLIRNHADCRKLLGTSASLYTSNRCLTSSNKKLKLYIRNKKLLVTSATLVVTGALLVVTRSY